MTTVTTPPHPSEGDGPHGLAASSAEDGSTPGALWSRESLVASLRRQQARGRTEVDPVGSAAAELIDRRLHGLRGWRDVTEDDVAVLPGMSREERMDLDRGAAARRRAQQALLREAQLRLDHSAGLLDGSGLETRTTRAVLAHRSDWFRSRLALSLGTYGITVVAECDDGAEAAGLLLAEQPDVALVEDLLPSWGGGEVLRCVREGAPGTRFAVQVPDAGSIDRYLSDGAVGVVTRRVPPAEVARLLRRCLGGGGPFVVR